MSLLWKELEQDLKRAPARDKRGRAVTPIIPEDHRQLSCRNCTLDKEPLHSPKMPPTGADNPLFYVLGEAPGKQEDEGNEQFVGKSGDVLRSRLPPKWKPWIRWNNSINCRPPENRDPTLLEMACCRNRIEDDIARTKPKVIMAFGAIAMQWLCHGQFYDAKFAGGRQRAAALQRGMPGITFWRGRRIPVRIKDHVCWAYLFVHPAWLARSQNDKKLGKAHVVTFERDIDRCFSDYEAGLPDPWVETPDDYRVGIEICTEFGAAGLRRIEQRLSEIAKRRRIGIDIETNGKKVFFVRTPKTLTMAVGSFDDTFVFGIDHQETRWTVEERVRLYEIVRNFLLSSGRKWAHYLKMEMGWLSYILGDEICYETEWGDTHAQAHAIDERPIKELEDLTLLYFGFDIKAVSDVDVSRLDEEPLEKVLWYNGMDCKYTDGLSIIQGDIISQLGLDQTYHNLARLTPSLVRMQAAGLVRNVPEAIKLHEELARKETAIRRQILEEPDVEKFRYTRAKPFNPASNDDMLAFFQWKGFKIASVGEEVLIDVDHPVARLELQRREEGKADSTYVKPLLDGGKHVALDGMVHPNFNQCVTVTTRLSSNDPNAQNFPRRTRKEIRRVIGCPPDSKFVAMDYGQIESRVVAMLSQDGTLVLETRRGDDIHAVWTEKLGRRFTPTRIVDKAGFKGVRDVIKNSWTFPLFFGTLPSSAAMDLSSNLKVQISERDLMPFFDEFWDKYPGVLAWQDKLVEDYWQRGYVELATGFRRHEPMNRNEIINHPVQGGAAQIVLDAQYRIDLLSYQQQRRDRAPRMNVHDDLSFYLLLKSLEEDIEFLAREMCCCSYSWINVPLAVEVSMGDNWCDKTEIHTFKSTDFQ